MLPYVNSGYLELVFPCGWVPWRKRKANAAPVPSLREPASVTPQTAQAGPRRDYDVLEVPKTVSPHATLAYSRSRPPSGSRRIMAFPCLGTSFAGPGAP